MLQDLLAVMAGDNSASERVAPLEIGANGGYTSLTFSNRLATSRNELGMEKEVAVRPNLDPQGLLQSAMGEDFVHSEENVVTYRQRESDEYDKISTLQLLSANKDPDVALPSIPAVSELVTL